MATQALNLSSVQSTQSAAVSAKSLKSDDISSSTSLIESDSSIMNKPGAHHQTDKESPIRATSTARPLSLNTGKRGHLYVNLPMELPVLERNRIRTVQQDTIPSTLDASAQLPAHNDPIHESFPPPELDEDNPDRFNQAELSETKCEQQDKFCWSPRFPPDGAAFYENSPPNSSISSSPTTKPIPDRKSIDSNDKRTQFLVNPTVISPPNTSAELKGFIFDEISTTISSASTTDSHLISSHASSFPLPTISTASEQLFQQHCRAHLETVSTNSTQMPTVTLKAFSPTVALTTLARPSITGCQYQNEPVESNSTLGCQTKRVGDSNVPEELSVSSVSPSSPVNHFHHQYQRLTSNNIQTQTVVELNRSISSPTPPPLPPPPSPPMAPAVPRRDPTTTLQQQQQPPQQSGNSPPCPTVPENVAVSKPMAANIDDNASTSLSSGTNQNRLTIDMSDNRKTGFSNLTGYSTNKDESTTSQIHIPPISTVPSTTHSVIKPVINRPTTMKTSPTTEYLMSPASYQRHVSFPNGTTTATVADGRSVVPWNLGTRDLSQEVADLPRTSETNTNNQETVTLSTSVFSDGTPQWIPPGQKSSRHRLLSCPPSKLVEFAAQDNTNSASVSVRNQITKDGRLGLAERPTCLLDKSQNNMETTQLCNRQKLAELLSCRSERSSRRHYTTSEMEMLRALNHQLSPGRTESATDQTPTEYLSGRSPFKTSVPIHDNAPITLLEYQPLSPAEAEWWRAQQRSKMIALNQAQTCEHPAMVNGNNLFQRQISAGPTFNFSPTKTKLSPSTGVFSEESSSLLIDAERNRSFKPDNYRTVAAKSSPRNCVSEQVAAQLREGNRTSLVYKIHGSGLPDTSARYVADPRMAHGDALPSMHLMQRVPFDEPQTPEGVDCESLPSMTQSVFFPPSAAWAQSTHHSFIDKSQCSSSGRRRRSKHGVSRSHSHRTVDQLKSKQLSRESDADQLGYGFPMAYYQRSISHTVPSDVTAATDEWPPVLAQWHHRRPVVYSTESFDPVVRSQWQIRKEKRSKSGRSTHDLVNVDVGRQMQPHHHSASAIFERLDIQPWFHFDLSRAKAEKILKSTPVGSFLVRQSETSKSEYSLSIRRENDVLHMRISKDENSGHYVLGEYSQPYPSISAMIYRYTRSLLPVRGTKPILLQFPVERTMQTQSLPKN